MKCAVVSQMRRDCTSLTGGMTRYEASVREVYGVPRWYVLTNGYTLLQCYTELLCEEPLLHLQPSSSHDAVVRVSINRQSVLGVQPPLQQLGK